jgi:hypothetical protein
MNSPILQNTIFTALKPHKLYNKEDITLNTEPKTKNMTVAGYITR